MTEWILSRMTRWGSGVALVLIASSVSGQSRLPTPAVAGSSPAFIVASIKENHDPDGPRLFAAPPGGGVTLINQTVRQLIYSAYQTQDYRVIGGPNWLTTERFDINAKADADVPPPQRLMMLRTLLADRFDLVMHVETRQLPVYVMTMARTDGTPGVGLKPSACVASMPTGLPAPSITPCGNRAAAGIIGSGGGTMDSLANQLGRLAVIGRPVVNRTGLTGAFDYEVTFDPNTGTPDSAPASERVSIFTALAEQLGVTLRASTAPMEVLVIDRIARPTPD